MQLGEALNLESQGDLDELTISKISLKLSRLKAGHFAYHFFHKLQKCLDQKSKMEPQQQIRLWVQQLQFEEELHGF